MSQLVVIEMDELLIMIKEAVNAGISGFIPYPSQTDNLKTYTRNEVADILKCSANTITKYINQGKLEATPLNGQYRINEKQLQKFLNNRK